MDWTYCEDGLPELDAEVVFSVNHHGDTWIADGKYQHFHRNPDSTVGFVDYRAGATYFTDTTLGIHVYAWAPRPAPAPLRKSQ